MKIKAKRIGKSDIFKTSRIYQLELTKGFSLLNPKEFTTVIYCAKDVALKDIVEVEECYANIVDFLQTWEVIEVLGKEKNDE